MPLPITPRGEQVSATRTPLTHGELRDALIQGHQTLRGGDEPNRNRLRFAWCHTCLETGGGKSSWNFNLGNIKTSSTDTGWSGRWYLLPGWTDERWDSTPKDKREWPYQRAHETAASGSLGYWRLMLARYLPATEIADSGDLEAASHKLRELGYYTADPVLYTKAMVQWSRVYDETWPDESAPAKAWTGLAALVVITGAVWALRGLST